MNPILQEFNLDLDRLRRMYELSEMFRVLPSLPMDPSHIQDEQLRTAVVDMHTVAGQSHQDIPILNGVLVLYLAGRFEYFVRELFEDLCNSLADQFTDFSHLPKAMRENLVRFTAEVIASPRKYGHAEGGVSSFIMALADNLSGKPLSVVNSKCLSITTENMWPETLSEIFGRIGVKEVWEKIGQQAATQAFFQVADPGKATKEAKRMLNELMALRNKIAHPSAGITWPSKEICVQYLEYCANIALVITELCALWSTTLGDRQELPQPAAQTEAADSTPQQ